MRIGIVISSAAVAAETHTTIHLADAALRAGHSIRVFEPWDFEVDERGRLAGRAHVFEPPGPGRAGLVSALHGRDSLRRSVEVDRLHVLLLRANPLQDAILTFGQLAQAAGVVVLNDPTRLMRTSHKGYLATLTGVPRPRTLVTRSRSAAGRFASEAPFGVVVKPARSCGGRGVSLVRGRRRDRLMESAVFAAANASGDGYVVVQDYLPDASGGEKRLLWLDGVLVGGYLRMRGPEDFRHNLKVGGQPLPCALDDRDHALADALSPHLLRDGVWFAGIDVIGGNVVEVNTLNPGGVHFSSEFSALPIAARVVASLAGRLCSPPPPSK